MNGEDSSRRAAGVAAALLPVGIWAGWVPVTRLGVVTRLARGDIAALRFGTAGLVLLPLLAMLVGAGVLIASSDSRVAEPRG
jgi:hypothetical protein